MLLSLVIRSCFLDINNFGWSLAGLNPGFLLRGRGGTKDFFFLGGGVHKYSKKRIKNLFIFIFVTFFTSRKDISREGGSNLLTPGYGLGPL